MSGKKKKGAGGAADVTLEVDQLLKALVLADSFDEKFRPLTIEAPRALLPVANIPLLEYTLEFLASGGVDEIIIFCCVHAKLIQEYIETSRWRSVPGVTVTVLVSTVSISAGDALREMESKGLLTSDFVLVSGDVVANMKLAEVVAAHL